MSTLFRATMLDDSPELLEQSYRLRYQVYCLERKFLPAADYPDQLETDGFDRHSVHVGVVDANGDLAGTARLIRASPAGLPLMHHCTVFPEDALVLDAAAHTVVEVSRLSISRRYTGRRDDGFYGVPERADADYAPMPLLERRRDRGSVFLVLVIAIYQAAKRVGATHWIAATEKSLQRLIVQLGLPFKQIGPEANYSGLVAPYVMSLAEFDRVILDRRIAALDDFLNGLEPEFLPRLNDPITIE